MIEFRNSEGLGVFVNPYQVEAVTEAGPKMASLLFTSGSRQIVLGSAVDTATAIALGMNREVK